MCDSKQLVTRQFMSRKVYRKSDWVQSEKKKSVLFSFSIFSSTFFFISPLRLRRGCCISLNQVVLCKSMGVGQKGSNPPGPFVSLCTYLMTGGEI